MDYASNDAQPSAQAPGGKLLHPSATLGDRLKALRGDLKQEDFAKAIAINRDSLRAYETGRSLPNAKVLAEICTKFSTNPQWLLLGEGPIRRDDQPDAYCAPQTSRDPNLAALTAAINAVERGLEETSRRMVPEKKAELITAIYELFTESADIEPSKIIRLIRAIA